MDPDYHAEIDHLDFLVGDDISNNFKEEKPYGMPEPKGEPVVTSAHPSVGILRDKTVWRQALMGQKLQ
eukprot:2773460-Ditylum_brightwellii.AAC.2